MNAIGTSTGTGKCDGDCGLYKSMLNQGLNLQCRIQDVLKSHFTDLEQDRVLKEIWCAWIEKCGINTSKLLINDSIGSNVGSGSNTLTKVKIVKLWDAFIETLNVKETLDLLTEYAYCEQSCEMICERIRAAALTLA